MMQKNNLNLFPKRWVLVRGLIRSKFHWGDFAEKFKISTNSESVECVELAGNGYLNHESTPERIEDAILQFKNQINPIIAPVGIIGISLGGMLAAKWAELYPNDVSHLVLINTSSNLSPFHARLRPQHYASIITNLALKDPAEMEKFILGATSNEKEKWLVILKDCIEFQKEHPVTLTNFIKQLKLTSQVDFGNIAHCKKLILASQKDRLVNYKCSEIIAEAIGSPIRYHPSAGHDLPLDDAAWVIEQISQQLS